jgi:D-aspartate ligase
VSASTTDEPGAIVVGCGHGGLAAIRSLGRRGLPVLGVSTGDDDIGLRSRFLAARASCPDPSADSSGFVDALLGLPERWDGSVILETEDRYTDAIAAHRNQLATRFVVAAAPHAASGWFTDKQRTAELATKVGVAVPATMPLDDSDQIAAAATALDFPFLVKPCHSNLFVDRFDLKLWIVGDRAELEDHTSEAHQAGLRVVAQELIPGSDAIALESIEFYINADGSWGPEQYNVKLRQAPPRFGVMRAGRSIDPVPELHRAARRLVEAIGYRGFASAEFKRDPRDGMAKLIEVNARLPRNLELLVRSGVDFPWIMYEDLIHGCTTPQPPILPTAFVDVVADVGHSLVRDRGALRRPVRLLSPYLGRRTVDAVFSSRDPRPFAALVGRRVRELIHRR